MKPQEIRTDRQVRPSNYDPTKDAKRDPNAMYFDGYDMEGQSAISLTKQSFKDECDINTILKQFEKTGQVNHVQHIQPIYGDFSQVAHYHEALNAVRDADHAFSLLPSAVRERFKNDPANLLAFVNDDRNYDEALELGLLDAHAKAREPIHSEGPDPAPKGKKNASPEPKAD